MAFENGDYFDALSSNPVDDSIAALDDFTQVASGKFRHRSPHLWEAGQTVAAFDDFLDEICRCLWIRLGDEVLDLDKARKRLFRPDGFHA